MNEINEKSLDIIKYFSNRAQTLVDALLVFVIGWYLVKLILHIFMKMLKKSSVDPIVISFVKSVLDIALKLLVVITAIAQLGIDTSSLVTVLATAGAAIVLGLKDSMSGVVSGMIILFTKPFMKGDIIEVNGHIGKIQEIQMLYTFLITFDNKMVVIPNNELATSTLINYSHEDIRRVDLEFDVSYDSDIDHAKKAMVNVIEKHEMSLKEPKPYVRVSQYKDSSITIQLRVWTNTEHYYELKDDLLEQVKAALDKENIEVPYPQLDVHIVEKKD